MLEKTYYHFSTFMIEEDYSVIEKTWNQEPKERLILEDLIKQLVYFYHNIL